MAELSAMQIKRQILQAQDSFFVHVSELLSDDGVGAEGKDAECMQVEESLLDEDAPRAPPAPLSATERDQKFEGSLAKL